MTEANSEITPEKLTLWGPFRDDPIGTAAGLREKHPSGIFPLEYPGGRIGYGILSYDIGRDALLSQDFIRWAPPNPKPGRAPMAELVYTQSLLNLNGPELVTQRRAFMELFKPGHLQATLAGQIKDIITEVVAELEPGTGNIAQTLGFFLPIDVMSGLMGIKHLPRETFQRWILTFLAPHNHLGGSTREMWEQSEAAGVEMATFLEAELKERDQRASDGKPVADLLDRIARSEVLEETPRLAMAILFMVAAFDTTQGSFGRGLLALLSDPKQLKLFRDHQGDRDFNRRAISELLRIASPTLTTSRHADKDTQLGGIDMPKGTELLLFLNAMNRDPAHFPEPNKLDLERNNAGDQLALGWGAHYCMGAILAKLELEHAWGELLRNFPDIALVGDGNVEPGPSPNFHDVQRLDVNLGARIS